MSLMSRAWLRVGPIEQPVVAEVRPTSQLGPATHFGDTSQDVADTEYLVTLTLAELTAKHGDSWAAAVEMFGSRS